MEHSSGNSMQELNDAIQMYPTDWIPYTVRGYEYAELGQYQLAIQDYDERIRLAGEYAPGIELAFTNRGLCYFELEQFQQAIDDCQKAVQLKPDYPQFYDNLGSIYQATGQ